MREARAVLSTGEAAGNPCVERAAGTAERAGHVDHVADAGAVARKRTRSVPKHSYRERELRRAGEVAASDRRVERTRCLANALGNSGEVLAPLFGDAHGDEHRDGRGSHRGEVAQRGGRGAIADLVWLQPSVAEMDVLDRGVGA